MICPLITPVRLILRLVGTHDGVGFSPFIPAVTRRFLLEAPRIIFEKASFDDIRQ